MKKTWVVLLAVVIFGLSAMPVLAEGVVDFSTRSNCWYDEQGNCGECYNYAAIDFFEQSDSAIPKLAILLDGKNIGTITPQTVKPKKNVELENIGSVYFGGIPVYSSGGYNVELKNGHKVQLAGYVEIPELVFSLWDISTSDGGGANVVVGITPLFGTEVPIGAASITIVDVVGKLGTISAGECSDYSFSFPLSRDEINILQNSEVTVEFNIAGNYYYSTMYFWSPYDEDYQSTAAKATSMVKARKMNKKK